MTHRDTLITALGLTALGLSLACAPASSGTQTLPSSTGLVSLCLSGKGIENWDGVSVLVGGVTLTPSDGGEPVTLFTGPGMGLPVNLAMLDHSTELVGNFAVPVGTYSAATLTLDAGGAPLAFFPTGGGYSGDPNQGFPFVTNGGTDAIFLILGETTQGGISPLDPTYHPYESYLATTVPLGTPLTVTTDRCVTLDVALDLSGPACLAAHDTAPGALEPYPLWTLDFDGTMSQQAVTDPTQRVLNPVAGILSSQATSGALTMAQVFSAYNLREETVPQDLKIRPDPANGTRCFDLPSDTSIVLKDFTSLSALAQGSNVVAAGRLQADGSLVASRLWLGNDTKAGALADGFTRLPAAAKPGVLTLEGEARDYRGTQQVTGGFQATVDAQTQFFLRNPANPALEAAPIGSGPAFLASNLGRGFRLFLHAHWNGTAFVARSVDLITPRFEGYASAVTAAQFTCTDPHGTNPADTTDAVTTLPFAHGFSWWNFATPLQVSTAPAALATPVARTIQFGGTAGSFAPWTTTTAVWGDPANPTGWSAKTTEVESLHLPDGWYASSWVASGSGGTFGMAVPGGPLAIPVQVDLATTRVYVNYTGLTQLIQLLDLTTPAGMATFLGNLEIISVAVTVPPVRVFGNPNADGSIAATTLILQVPG